MLKMQIIEAMQAAMKARDQVRLDALRYVISEIKNAEIDAKMELGDEAVQAILKREVKKRKEAIEQMKAVGRQEMVAVEEAKVAVIGEFMMEEMSREEVAGLVDQVVNSGVNDFCGVMREVMGMAKGKADGKMVSEVVKKKLSN